MSSNVLTPEEEKIIRNASIASSCEIDQLLEIIHRLVKLLVESGANQPRYFTTILDGSSIDRPLFSDRAESEIQRIAREVAREEIQKCKDDEEVPF